jgi:hypothetical protein
MEAISRRAGLGLGAASDDLPDINGHAPPDNTTSVYDCGS